MVFFLLALLVVLFLLVHFVLPVRLVLTLLVLLMPVILVGFFICSSLFQFISCLRVVFVLLAAIDFCHIFDK